MMSVWLVSEGKRLQLSEHARAFLDSWRTPGEVLDFFNGLRTEICRIFPDDDHPVRHLHQHASFQSAKEAFVVAAAGKILGWEKVRTLSSLNHPDAEVRSFDGSTHLIEVVASEKIGRNPSSDRLFRDDGFVVPEYFSTTEIRKSVATSCEKKAAKRYPRGGYSLLIYLNGFELHPEERLNEKILTEACASASELFRKILVFNHGIRQIYEDGSPAYRVWE